MREILFRGKRTINGKWTESDCITQSHKITRLWDDQEAIWVSVISDTVSQYIGLNDGRGTKIFDGDILRFRDDDLNCTWLGKIEFGNPNSEYNWGWQIVPIGECKYDESILMWIETELPNVHCEIIGNIWDSPELLGVKQK